MHSVASFVNAKCDRLKVNFMMILYVTQILKSWHSTFSIC